MKKLVEATSVTGGDIVEGGRGLIHSVASGQH